MKKAVLSLVYLSGWIYPLSVTVYTVLDYFFKIKTTLMGPFDFGNDSIMGYIFSSIIFAFVTFTVYFVLILIKRPASKLFYLTLINLPLYILSIACVFLGETYVWIAIVSLTVFVATIIFTLSFNIKANI